ncbi:MAG: hypothetical protein AAGI11_20415 [Pseudomonadota bacterium]
MKKLIGVFITLLLAAPVANANCKIPQINGTWEGVIVDASTGTVSVCTFSVKGRDLLGASGCTDSLGQEGGLSNDQVTLTKNTCTLEVEYVFEGVAYEFAFTIDRQKTVMTGFGVSSDGTLVTANFVKKP